VLAQAERLSEPPAMMLGMAPEQSSQHPLVGRADELDRVRGQMARFPRQAGGENGD